MLAARHPLLMEGVSRRLAAYAPHAKLLVVDDPPVIGAALLGLDAVGASPDAKIAARDAVLARTRTTRSPEKRLLDRDHPDA